MEIHTTRIQRQERLACLSYMYESINTGSNRQESIRIFGGRDSLSCPVDLGNEQFLCATRSLASFYEQVSSVSIVRRISQLECLRPRNHLSVTGYSGRITELVANFVKIEQLPELVVCQYHVEFDPVVDSKAFRHAMLKQKSIQDEIGSVFIFDGMILYLVSNENLEV